MAKHTKTAREAAKERLNARIRAESKRTGEDLDKRKPPRPVKRGKYSTTKSKASVSVKPKGVIDVLRGGAARKREEKATKPRKKR